MSPCKEGLDGHPSQMSTHSFTKTCLIALTEFQLIYKTNQVTPASCKQQNQNPSEQIQQTITILLAGRIFLQTRFWAKFTHNPMKSRWQDHKHVDLGRLRLLFSAQRLPGADLRKTGRNFPLEKHVLGCDSFKPLRGLACVPRGILRPPAIIYQLFCIILLSNAINTVRRWQKSKVIE